MSDNDVCNITNYRDQVYEILPNVQVLDGKDRDGQSFISFEADEYGEEGEEDMEEDEQMQAIMDKLDPDTRKRFEAGEIGVEDLKGLGILDPDFKLDDDSEYGAEIYGSEEGEAEGEEIEHQQQEMMDEGGEIEHHEDEMVDLPEQD